MQICMYNIYIYIFIYLFVYSAFFVEKVVGGRWLGVVQFSHDEGIH